MNCDSLLENLIRELGPQNSPHSFLDIREAIGVIVIDDDVSVSLLDDADDGDGADESESARNQQVLDVTH